LNNWNCKCRFIQDVNSS